MKRGCYFTFVASTHNDDSGEQGRFVYSLWIARNQVLWNVTRLQSWDYYKEQFSTCAMYEEGYSTGSLVTLPKVFQNYEWKWVISSKSNNTSCKGRARLESQSSHLIVMSYEDIKRLLLPSDPAIPYNRNNEKSLYPCWVQPSLNIWVILGKSSNDLLTTTERTCGFYDYVNMSDKSNVI